MRGFVLRSLVFVVFACLVMAGVHGLFATEKYLPDVGGLSAFVTVFGTLYGIMAAFVVFEVWNQYNQTQQLIEKEAQGLESLFRLTLYFRDKKLTATMKGLIEKYSKLVISERFRDLGEGSRNAKASRVFRQMSSVISEINFDDDHDSVVFGHIVDHYGNLSSLRAERINQSLTRLPVLLKTFLYSSSALALGTFILMPFANIDYGLLATATLSFVLAMVFQLVEDLDNPFVGIWNITPEPFERALKHIEEDY